MDVGSLATVPRLLLMDNFISTIINLYKYLEARDARRRAKSRATAAQNSQVPPPRPKWSGRRLSAPTGSRSRSCEVAWTLAPCLISRATEGTSTKSALKTEPRIRLIAMRASWAGDSDTDSDKLGPIRQNEMKSDWADLARIG